MTNVRPARKRVSRLWFAALLVAPASGCHRVPLRYHETDAVDSSVLPHDHSADNPSVVTRVGDPPAEPLPPLPVPALAESGKVLPERSEARPGRFVSANSPTPHLDAAIARAEARANAPVDDAKPALAPPTEAPPLELPPETLANVPTPATPKAGPVDPQVKPASLPPEPKPETEPKPEPAPVLSPAPADEVLPAPEPAAAKAIDPEKPMPRVPTDPTELWRTDLDRLRDLARSRSAEPGEDADAWRVRLRLLDSLRGDPPASDSVELWTRFLDVVDEASGTEGPNEERAAAQVRKAIDSLEHLVPLQINELQVCRKVHGFGHVDPLDAKALRAGQTLIVYCETEGLRYEPADGAFRSRLSSRVELIRKGEPDPAWSTDLGTADDLCRRRRRDYYVNYRLTLPADLAPGSYELRLSQNDRIGDRTATSSVPIKVQR